MSEKKGFSAPFWGKTEGNWGPVILFGAKSEAKLRPLLLLGGVNGENVLFFVGTTQGIGVSSPFFGYS